MEYKILESNDVLNENIDGAAFNNFSAQNKSGVIKGILDECKISLPDNKTISISSGEIIISGFRVKITQPYVYSFTSLPATSMNYQVVAEITLQADRKVDFEIITRPLQNLRTESLFVSEKGFYEVEIVNFTLTSSGITNISDVNKIDTSRGTVVTVNGVAQDTFDADTKVDKTYVDEAIAGLGGGSGGGDTKRFLHMVRVYNQTNKIDFIFNFIADIDTPLTKDTLASFAPYITGKGVYGNQMLLKANGYIGEIKTSGGSVLNQAFNVTRLMVNYNYTGFTIHGYADNNISMLTVLALAGSTGSYGALSVEDIVTPLQEPYLV